MAIGLDALVCGGQRAADPALARAIGSAGERLVHTEEVTGSIPVSPTRSEAFCNREAIVGEPDGEPKGVGSPSWRLPTPDAAGTARMRSTSTPQRTGTSGPSRWAMRPMEDGSAGRSLGRPSRK